MAQQAGVDTPLTEPAQPQDVNTPLAGISQTDRPQREECNPSQAESAAQTESASQAETAPAKRGFFRELVEWVLYIVAAFVLASLIQSEVFALTEVNMSSMESTLLPQDKLVMNKLAYRFGEPDRGDILIFLKDEPTDGFVRRMSVYLSDVTMKFQGEFRRNRLIKRVIALPGETVEIRNNQVFVNGELLDEPYARVDPDAGEVVNGELALMTIPENMIFVMGDNRGKSLDSRSFGCISLDTVEGRAVLRVAPIAAFGKL